MEDADLLRAALILEEREKKFFSDVSIKVPLPEVARIFRKMAQKKQENLDKTPEPCAGSDFKEKDIVSVLPLDLSGE